MFLVNTYYVHIKFLLILLKSLIKLINEHNLTVWKIIPAIQQAQNVFSVSVQAISAAILE